MRARHSSNTSLSFPRCAARPESSAHSSDYVGGYNGKSSESTSSSSVKPPGPAGLRSGTACLPSMPNTPMDGRLRTLARLNASGQVALLTSGRQGDSLHEHGRDVL